MKNIIITGATSFIGINILKELKNNEYNIYAIIRPNSINKDKLNEFSNLKIIELDQKEIENLKLYLKKVDICIHLAWEGTRVPERYDEKIQEQNYINSVKTFEAVTALGCDVFLGTGSQAEYGFVNDIITEETETNPNTEYGKFKLKTCLELEKKALENNVRFIWGRIFSVYGEGDYENTLIMSTLRNMKKNKDVNMTEGKQYWNYIYIKDLSKIIINLIFNKEAKGIFNLASNDTRPLKEYILDMKKALNSKSKINFGVIPYRQEGIVNIKPSILKLNNILKINYDSNFYSKFRTIISEVFLWQD
uniref:NAD-dependent epimerase/dehydratase family protein n=1 Tax=Megamonas funiformis TaxID=437897 RepID=UPI002676F173|nr:NAD(P)-dependent oxidoreductase [Megamonas funiformis]